MVNHKKPTTKELEEQAQKELEEVERLEAEERKNTPPPITEDPPADPIPEPTPAPNAEPSTTDDPDPQPTPSPSQPPKEEDDPPSPSPSPDFRKKFSESSRGAQKLYGQNKIFNEAIDAIEDMPQPTDDEMKAEYSDYDIMGDSEKDMAKEAVISRQFRKIMGEARQKAKKVENWEESVDKFVDNPETLIKHPDLEGLQEDFKAFAKKDGHSTTPFNLLVSAFLHDNVRKIKRNKGSQFQTTGGGPGTPEKKDDGKISLAQAEVLKTSNYKLYVKYLKADKIADE